MARETKKKANSKSANPKEAKPKEVKPISDKETALSKAQKDISEQVEKKPKKLKTKLSEHTAFKNKEKKKKKSRQAVWVKRFTKMQVENLNIPPEERLFQEELARIKRSRIASHSDSSGGVSTTIC